MSDSFIPEEGETVSSFKTIVSVQELVDENDLMRQCVADVLRDLLPGESGAEAYRQLLEFRVQNGEASASMILQIWDNASAEWADESDEDES